MSNVRKRLHDQLQKRREKGNHRTLQIKEGLIDFSSNDYLGLSSNQNLNRNILETISTSTLPHGATGSRLLTGNSSMHQELESHLADFFEAPAALLFNSGYVANLALVSTIPGRGDTILYDQAIHACIKEGARLSKAHYISFRHNDMLDLRNKLSRAKGNLFVVIESLYSMEGDFPPVEEIIAICREFSAELFIDEAHTTGWAGSGGRGWVTGMKLNQQFLGRVYTFGKAIGLHGACVVGSREVIDYLINYARPFIYTTALPAHSLISLQCALHFLAELEDPGEGLKEKINIYLERFSKLALKKSLNQHSPIQWIMCPGNKNAVELSRSLQSKGFDVRPILSPTVPEGSERLRICIHSFNTKQQIFDLAVAISNKQ